MRNVIHFASDCKLTATLWLRSVCRCLVGRDMTDVSQFDYDLPEELVAVTPAERRDESRLLCMDRRTGVVSHGRFPDIAGLLRPGDVLVVNDARVIPARLAARRPTGGRVEALLVRPHGGQTGDAQDELTWVALLNAGGSLKAGEELALDGSTARLRLVEDRGEGCWVVRLAGEGVSLARVLDAGTMPLPPYIRKARKARGMAPDLPELDRERYQTVFACHPGAVAAPTAGLHFTAALLDRLRAGGVQVCALSLLVGPGTFRPVHAARVEDHVLEAEFYHLPAETAAAVAAALAERRRVVATGTTCCRVLEYVAGRGDWREHSGWTDLYIHPPFEFRVVGALLTNFHLPRSTLLMLVSAFAGRERVLAAYQEAIAHRYRFYSYGDAMLIH